VGYTFVTQLRQATHMDTCIVFKHCGTRYCDICPADADLGLDDKDYSSQRSELRQRPDFQFGATEWNETVTDYVILKNRKVLGELLPHRIRQGGPRKPAGPLIQEMTPAVPTPSHQPQYRIRHEPSQAEHPEYLVAEFFMKNLVCCRT